MTVTIVGTRSTGLRASVGSDFHRTYVEQQRITSDSTRYQIINALPQVGESLDIDPRASLDSVDLERVGDCADEWTATLTYTTKPRRTCAENATDNPLAQPPEIFIDFEQFQRVVDVDLNQKPIRASSREIYNPRPEIDDSRPVIFVTQNEATLGLGTILDYQDAVNSDEIWGLQPRQAKLRISAQMQQYQNENECFTYWRKTYVVSLRREGWLLTLADAGVHQWGALYDRPIPIKGNDDEYITEPVFLDGEGLILADGEDPIFNEFEVYRELPFSVLGLPGSLE